MERTTGILAGLMLAALMVRPAMAQEVRTFGLQADTALQTSGLLDYILPRFALKTGRRVDPDLAPDVSLGVGQGDPVFTYQDDVYGAQALSESDAAARFLDWLRSDVGIKTVLTYAEHSGEPFAEVSKEVEADVIYFEGDANAGHDVAAAHCTRCHKVSPEDRSTIGSTPSFMALKAIPDWADRFAQFYLLNPHPSFIQIEDMTAPFDPRRPPSLVPVEITVDELNDLLAYVQSVAPADLGAEVAHQ
ncbi:c-type cytochrome [Donghicola eburneus]|uniref:c-type cytochrome n=1 Tax=Donghicola eburneus TaxID=393278 RepID=UPI001160A49C|nr:c-type cytochrome [Donghicola eburneus]